MVGILHWMDGDDVMETGRGPQGHRVQRKPLVIGEEVSPRL